MIITVACAIWYLYRKKKDEAEAYILEPGIIKIVFKSVSGASINLLNWTVWIVPFGTGLAPSGWAINYSGASPYIWRKALGESANGIVTMEDGQQLQYDNSVGILYEKVVP